MLGMHDTVTVWNRFRNPETRKDEWYRRVIDGCSWEQESVVDTSGAGAVIGNVYSVLIAAHEDYRAPPAWIDRDAHWTLQVGDIVAKGIVGVEITGTSPNREADVLSVLSPAVFTVKAVLDESEPHKQGRHYEVKGL